MRATPKLDGIRCLIWQVRALTHKLRPIPNWHIRHALEAQHERPRTPVVTPATFTLQSRLLWLPQPPPELANFKIERPTPEMLEEARRTFDEAEYLAGVRAIEAGGGVTFEEIMTKIERKLHGRMPRKASERRPRM